MMPVADDDTRPLDEVEQQKVIDELRSQAHRQHLFCTVCLTVVQLASAGVFVVLHRQASTGSALGFLAVALALAHTLHRGPYSRPLLLAAVGGMLAAAGRMAVASYQRKEDIRLMVPCGLLVAGCVAATHQLHRSARSIEQGVRGLEGLRYHYKAV
eukprot:TRINITY_DN7351_c0_g1_i1.p2 TRINITY_DN7351_c0_g1~~TRINITY_DN7351_c0_g1_i1.p2  ORF type:complete len:163 (-),score=34.01 TRINITY_DN7351_c0_g1_i1:122-589(-)